MSSLFRENALSSLHAEEFSRTSIGKPPAAWSICLILVSAILLTTFYVGNRQYARKIPVQGYIDSHDAKKVVARDFGQLTELIVSEGDLVEKDQYLGRLANRQFNDEGDIDQAVNKEISAQIEHWTDIRASVAEQANANQQRLRTQIRQLRSKYALLNEDLRLQGAKVSHLSNYLENTSELKRSGHISKLDWINFQTALITEQQRLNQLQQERLGVRQQIIDLHAESAALKIRTTRHLKEIELELSAVNQRKLAEDRQGSQRLIAPISGRVSRINVKPGETLLPGQAVLYVSAEPPELSGTLVIPSHASGFISVGQELQLEIDAFPAAHHGRILAVMTQISNHNVSDDPLQGSYLARLRIDDRAIKNFELKPGMNFKSHIMVDQKTIFAWVFQPVLDWIAA